MYRFGNAHKVTVPITELMCATFVKKEYMCVALFVNRYTGVFNSIA